MIAVSYRLILVRSLWDVQASLPELRGGLLVSQKGIDTGCNIWMHQQGGVIQYLHQTRERRQPLSFCSGFITMIAEPACQRIRYDLASQASGRSMLGKCYGNCSQSKSRPTPKGVPLRHALPGISGQNPGRAAQQWYPIEAYFWWGTFIWLQVLAVWV